MGARSLWHSCDGGTSWTDDSGSIPGGVNVHDGAISFIDQTTGWLVGFRAATDEVVLLATQDGAVTWHSLPLPGHVREVVFFDETHGFAAAARGQAPFHATDDGGNTWKLSILPAKITRVSQEQVASRPQ